jgi:hypothetical protein
MAVAGNLNVSNYAQLDSTGFHLTGSIAIYGAAGGYSFDDRGTPGNTWQWYATAGSARLYSSVAGGDLISVTTGGVMNVGATAGTRFSGTIYPAADNTLYCGYGGNSWISVSSYAFANASDPTLKTAIEPAPPALDAVLALSPKTYRWKAGPDTERRHHGFLATDVRDVLGEEFGGWTEDKENGLQSLAYHELTAVLWRAVQELSARVTALEARGAPGGG